MDYTQRFSSRAMFYAKHRPSYPVELLDFFGSRLGLPPRCVIADIGSGTGLLTELLLQLGDPVYAVEPNAEMRSAAEAALSGNPAFKSIIGASEATTLADQSVDLITAGQAFHWFDRPKTKIEFTRILKTGGWVALIWNERRSKGTPFNLAYAKFTDEFEAERFEGRHQALTSGEMRPFVEFFAPGGFEVASFDNHKVLDLAGLTGLILSSSAMPLPGHPKYAAMAHAIPRLFEAHQRDDVIRIDYDTRVYYGRMGLDGTF